MLRHCSIPVVVAMAALFLPACTVNQQAEVDTYRRELDQGMPQIVEELRHDEPLTLQRALFLANLNDEQLSIRGEQYLQSLISRARAAAGLLPNVSASAGYNFSGNGSNSGSSRSVGLSGSVTVFNLRTLKNIEVAGASAEQQRLLLLDLQQTVLIGVAANFYQVLVSEDSVRVLENSLLLRGEQVRDIQARTRLGIARPLDLAQAQADESSTRVALLQAESNARNARTTLAFLLGLRQLDQPLADLFEPSLEQPSPDDFEQAAIDNRLDFAAAREGVEVASLVLESAYAQYYPSANLNLSYLLYTRPGGGNPYSIGLSLFEPIFNAGLIHQDVRAAYSQLRQAVLTQDRFARLLHEDIQLAYEDFITSTNKLRELEVGVVAARRANDLAAAQYRVGTATNLDQLSTQNQLLSAQLQLSNEHYNQKVFYLNLLRATGQFRLLTPGQLPAGEVGPATN